MPSARAPNDAARGSPPPAPPGAERLGSLRPGASPLNSNVEKGFPPADASDSCILPDAAFVWPEVRPDPDLVGLLAVHFDQTIHTSPAAPAGESSGLDLDAPLHAAKHSDDAKERSGGLRIGADASSVSNQGDHTSAGNALARAAAASGMLPKLPQQKAFGHYELIAEIARGGMGVVYQARHVQLDRVVALKMVLSGRCGDAQEVERLLQEAQTAAHLSHPNLVAIHEVGEFEGRHFFAMDFVRGQSLAETIRQRLRSPNWSAKCIEKIARAIHYAHEHGVLHRDLKPSNILIDEAGEPHVTDFGVAKRLDLLDARSTVGEVIGTPSYMPPEQAAGKKEWVGPASDVYSLGAILYELLTGRPPFQAANALELFLQVKNSDPLPPSLLNPRTPPDLQTICLKCLEKDPRRRYASAAALADDLERFLQEEPIEARPTGCFERGWKWARKHPSSAALVLVLFFTAIGVHALEWYFRSQLNDSHAQLQSALDDSHRQRQMAERRKLAAEVQQAEAQRLRDAAEAQRQLAEQRELTARRYLYSMHLNQIQQAWEKYDTARVLELLEQQIPTAGQVDLRGFEWFFYWKLLHADQATLAGHSQAVTRVAYSPDGAWIASASEDGAVVVWNARTKARAASFSAPTAVECLAFAPRGGVLLGGCGDGRVLMWNVAKGTDLGELPPLAVGVSCLAVSPDGLRAAAGGDDGSLRFWSLQSKASMGDSAAHAARVHALAFSPDGKTFASGDEAGKILLWHLGKQDAPTPLAGHDSAVRGLAFAQGGATLYSAGLDDCLLAWDVAERKLRGNLRVNRGGIVSMALSPDERFVALGTGLRTLLILEAQHWREVGETRGHSDVVRSISFSPDSKTAATGSVDGTVKLWDVRQPLPESTFRHREGEATSVAFSPKGDWLATGWGRGPRSDAPSEVWVRDRTSGRTLATLPVVDGVVQSIAVSPGGKYLAAAARGPHPGDGRVLVWRTSDWKPLDPFAHVPGSFQRVAFGPSGDVLFAAGGDGKVHRWDVATGESLPAWSGHQDEIVDLSLASNGSTLATSSLDGTVRLWDAQEGLCLQVFSGYLAYSPVAFSPGGAWLATAASDPLAELHKSRHARREPVVLLPCSTIGQIAVIDLQTKTERFILKKHAQSVQRVAFSPDGRRIVTAGREGQLRIWDAVTGHQLAQITAHKGVIYDLAFSPDGAALVTVGSDGQARVLQTGDDPRPQFGELDGEVECGRGPASGDANRSPNLDSPRKPPRSSQENPPGEGKPAAPPAEMRPSEVQAAPGPRRAALPIPAALLPPMAAGRSWSWTAAGDVDLGGVPGRRAWGQGAALRIIAEELDANLDLPLSSVESRPFPDDFDGGAFDALPLGGGAPRYSASGSAPAPLEPVGRGSADPAPTTTPLAQTSGG